MKWNIALSSAVLAAACLFSTPTAFALPAALNYQGRLLSADGEAVTGTKDLKISVFDASSAGAMTWQETLSVTLNDKGFFNVILGRDQALDSSVFDGNPAWIEIEIDGSALSPRLEVSSVPYAILAGGVAKGSITGDSFAAGALDWSLIENIPASVNDAGILAGLNCSEGDSVAFQGGSWNCVSAPTHDDAGIDDNISIDNGALHAIAGQTSVGINTNATAEALTVDGNISLVYGSARSIGIPNANNAGTTLTINAAGNISSHGSASRGGELILQAGNANVSATQACNDDYAYGPFGNSVKIIAGDNVFTGNCGTKRNGDIIFYAGHNQRERLRIVGNNGFVGVGTTQPHYKMQVNGRVAGVGAYINLSDERYKKNIKPIRNAMEKIAALRGVSYDWRQQKYPDIVFEEQRQLGFVAQELKEVLPEAVSIDDSGVYSIAYSKVTPVLVEAIKTQQKTIEELRQTQGMLLKRLEHLENLQK